jgi:hypothetical protein
VLIVNWDVPETRQSYYFSPPHSGCGVLPLSQITVDSDHMEAKQGF